MGRTMPSPSPICTIIAGPNGAGKTTFALKFLPEVADCKNFVNADMIAAGLSPLSPERDWLAAARLFLLEVRHYIKCRESFAFETTLSGRTYVPLIHDLMAEGWTIDLIYLWIPSAEVCLARVAERVAQGGHDIPSDIVSRRFARSARNLFDLYAPTCTSVICLENSGLTPRPIFVQGAEGRVILNATLFNELLRSAEI